MKKALSVLSGIFSPLVCVVVVLTLLLNVIWPDHETSYSENRSLQTFPAFSMEDIQNGEYFDDISAWFSDQFVGRDSLMKIKYIVSKLTGTKKIQDVYLTKGALIEEVGPVNESNAQRNIAAVNQFASSTGVSTYFMIVPNAANIQSENLPAFAGGRDQNAQMDAYYNQLSDSVTKIDVRDSFNEHQDEYIYYKTDHHWTSLGAWYGFEALASSMGLGTVSIDNYDIYPVSNDFCGTLSSRVGSAFMEDRIDIYVPKDNSEYVMTDETNGTASRSIYSLDALDTKDQYTVFLSGNSGRITLEMDNNSDRHLLLIKDSYANAMIQFLIPYFRTIDIIDPRYYYENVEDLMDTRLITDVLYLYNSNTLMQDTSMADCLAVTQGEE